MHPGVDDLMNAAKRNVTTYNSIKTNKNETINLS